MSTVTENDLRELKDLINTRFSELERKLDIHIVRTDEKFKSVDQRFDFSQILELQQSVTIIIILWGLEILHLLRKFSNK